MFKGTVERLRAIGLKKFLLGKVYNIWAVSPKHTVLFTLYNISMFEFYIIPHCITAV